jgi:hypothetical protein
MIHLRIRFIEASPWRWRTDYADARCDDAGALHNPRRSHAPMDAPGYAESLDESVVSMFGQLLTREPRGSQREAADSMSQPPKRQ